MGYQRTRQLALTFGFTVVENAPPALVWNVFTFAQVFLPDSLHSTTSVWLGVAGKKPVVSLPLIEIVSPSVTVLGVVILR